MRNQELTHKEVVRLNYVCVAGFVLDAAGKG